MEYFDKYSLTSLFQFSLGFRTRGTVNVGNNELLKRGGFVQRKQFLGRRRGKIHKENTVPVVSVHMKLAKRDQRSCCFI